MATTEEPVNQVNQSEPIDLTGHAELFLKTIIAGIGLAYGTGYLVVLTFLNEYGIREAGGEVFKLRYIYVGALCLACPVAIASIVHALLSSPNSLEVGVRVSTINRIFRRFYSPSQYTPTPLTIIILNLIMVFYCMIAFAHPGLFAAKQNLFNWLYVPMAATLILRLVFGEDDLWKRRSLNIIRWVLVLISVVISVLILRGINFASMFRDRIQNYLFLQILFLFFLYRFTKWPAFGATQGRRRARALVRTMILATLFILGVFSFAHTVFNHIPAEKGGGDFTQVPDDQVCFSSGHGNGIPTSLMQDPNRQPPCTVPVKIIEQTSTQIYVARADDRGDRSEKDAPNPAALWRSGRYYPTVFEINRSIISAIVIMNHGYIQASAKAPK